MTASATTAPPTLRPEPAAPAPARRRGRFGVHLFLSTVSLAFLAPFCWPYTPPCAPTKKPRDTATSPSPAASPSITTGRPSSTPG